MSSRMVQLNVLLNFSLPAEKEFYPKGDGGEAKSYDPYEYTAENMGMLYYVIILIIVTVNSLASCLGSITNILNVIVFCRQGFKDSVTICLATVSSFDIVKCMFGFVPRLRAVVGLFSPSLSISIFVVYMAKLTYIHIIANFVTYPLAAYIAVERAACVSLPFKVKAIFTPKTASWAMGVISTTVVLAFSYLLFIFDLTSQWNNIYNKTMLIHKPSWFFRTYRVKIMKYHNLLGLFDPLLSLITIVISTMIISYHLKKSSKFRAKAQSAGMEAPKEQQPSRTSSAVTPSGQDNKNKGNVHSKDSKTVISNRDRQVIKMLLVVILMFVLNMIPRLCHQIGKMVEPEFYQLRGYHQEYVILSELVFALDFINSSANFFIFFQMNKNFRTTFKSIFMRSAK